MIATYSPTGTVRAAATVESIMQSLPVPARRWCGMDRCECSGCANAVVSRDEWLAWFIRQTSAVCARCNDAVYRVGGDGRKHLACESCDTFWS